MNCARCRHENRAGAKFCEECAAPLAPRCGNCGGELSATARFCSECGAAQGLGDGRWESGARGREPGAAARPDPRPPTPDSYTPRHLAEKILTSKSALEGERKQVTVLFADVKGSMDLAEQVYAEE